MKPTLLSLLAIGVAAVGLTAFAQNANQPTPQGQGQGGTPHAWCDRNADGICDITGLPVGQGRARMMAAGEGGQQGRGMGRGMGGMGRGMGRGMAGGMGRGMNCPYGQNAPPADSSSQPGPSPTN